MIEHEKKPAIRFAGFTNSWEQRKLGGCFDERQERSADGELISVTINDGIKKFSELGRHDNSSENKSNYKRVEIGDIAYNSMRMWQGANGYSPYSGILSPAYTVLIPKNGVDAYFFSFVFKRPEMIHVFQTNSQGITSDTWNLKYPALSEISTMVPKVEEQQEIAHYFIALNTLITLHQRKHDKLVNLKKAMLEKMFPQQGADAPEIRFAGFTDAWKQSKIGDFYNFKNGLNKGKAYFGKGTPIVNFTDVFHKRGLHISALKGKVTLSPAEILNYDVLKGDIFFTRTSETIEEIGFSSVMLDDPKDTVFSGFVLRGRSFDLDPLTLKFKQYVFYTGTFRCEMIKKSSMTTRALTSGTAIKQMEFQYPISKNAQDCIGNFLDAFDTLITLHQQELEKLRNVKKSCLEKMFV